MERNDTVGRNTDIYHGPISGSVVGGRDHTINMMGHSSASVFDILEPYITKDALYNSQKRDEEHASTCHPNTHARVIRSVEGWANGTGNSVCWLYGPAGTGKSTIAHTIAESKQDTQLAGTFFFSRNKGAREDIRRLIPTLAYQIAERIPSVRMQMQTVLCENRTLLAESLKRQFLKLIVEPLMNISSDRSLVVIDGLDECAARDRIVDLIEFLGETMTTHKCPLQFLLTSRPEPEICAAFILSTKRSTFLWLALEDSRDDVRKYLRSQFMKIRRKYGSVMAGQPMKWPSNEELEELVRKSEGLFIYASTVVQYLNDRHEPPQDKLRKVLRVHDGVDPLYTQVISEAQQCNNFDQVIGSLMYLREPLAINELALLLRLDNSKIRIALDRCHSVLAIPPDDDAKSIRPYHASLRDFLTDHERSRDYFCAPAKFHAHIAIASLQAITHNLRISDVPVGYACVAWYHHCSSLLSEANTSEDFQLLCTQVKAEIEKVSLEWLKYWMVEALMRAGVNYIRVNLPSPKGMRRQAKDVHTWLFRIGKVLDDFLNWYDVCENSVTCFNIA